MTGTLLLYNLKLNFLIFFYQSKHLTDYSLFIRTYTVNYRNALDRLVFVWTLSCFLDVLPLSY